MATVFKLGAYNAADTAVAGTSMNALASGSYALGAAINNSVDLFMFGDLELILSGAVTTGSVNPFVSAYLLPSMDGGTTYPTPPGGSAGAIGGSYSAGTVSVPVSVSTLTLHIRGIQLTPWFKIMILNTLGVAFPATNTSTLKLYRYSPQAV